MRKLLSSPVKMPLSDTENNLYQTALSFASEISLNLMATKVDQRPEDFLGWCQELLRLSQESLNVDLLEENQLLPYKKLQDTLKQAIGVLQIRMLKIAPWPIIAGVIEQLKTQNVYDEREKLLHYINTLKHTPLSEMIIEDRLAYCGKHTARHDISVYNFDVEWFASTKAASVFHQLMQATPALFDQALAHIPETGEVTPKHYFAFAQAYQDIFTNHKTDKPAGEKAPLAPATRLLAMRRPDQFIALTNAKLDVLSQGFSIVKLNSFDLLGYWQDLISALRVCPFWRAESPENESELFLWQHRAILVDCFLYADSKLAENSNYVKLRDKPKKVHVPSMATDIARKRSKESAELLVDKVLNNQELPAFIASKRDTIIKQVSDGKSVDQAISLLRAIFG